MKKITLLFLLVVSMFTIVNAQTTSYGENAGTLGHRGSYFGMGAGGSLILDDPAATRYIDNSFFGYYCGSRTISIQNTAMGSMALYENTTGERNVAIGFNAQYYNTTGHWNTAVGAFSLEHNTTARGNVAIGAWALRQNTTGFQNTAVGFYALSSNTSGRLNTAVGNEALKDNTTGTFNVATGTSSMKNNTTGLFNSAYGGSTMSNNSTGSLNSAFGYLAGPTGAALANTTALGFGAAPTSSNQVRIGNRSVESIGGQVSWSTLSDGRFKRDIKEDIAGIEFIRKLRPVSYTVDTEAIDRFLGVPDSTRQLFPEARKDPARQSGFVAQEVEAIIKKTGFVFNGVEAPQNEKDHYSIRYAEFVVPLVKAVQELTAKIEMQEKVAGEQKVEIEALKEQLKLGSASNDGQIISNNQVALYQNNPNPFSMDTEIRMSLPETTRQATLIVYNMEGKQLKVVPINDRGKALVKIQSNELKAGMYLYTLIVDGLVADTKRMILTGN